MKFDKYTARELQRAEHKESFRLKMEAYDDEIRLLAASKQLPDCLPLYEIAILSNINPDAFRRVIERSTGIELVEQEFEYRGWKTGKKYRDKGITKAAYKSYLQSLGRWPVDGLLADWWINEQSNATTQTDNKPNLTAIKTNVFCNPPKKKDSWFDAIEETALTLFNELGKLPNEAQAWGRLSANPPPRLRNKAGSR